MRKIGICSHAISGVSNEEYAKIISELGFDTIFTGVAKNEADQAALAELYSKHGIEYETIHAPFGHINDIWLDCEGGEKMLAELIQSVDNCAAAGVPILVTHLSSGLTPPSVTDLGQNRFATLMEHAEKKNVIIAYENQRKLSNIAWAFEQFASSPSLGFCWDCGHENCFTYGRQYMPIFGKKLVCTHIHDNLGPIGINGQNDLHMLPFDGSFDYTRFARQLNEAGYTGSLMLEVMKNHSQGFYDKMSSETYMQRAADAVKKLRTIVDGE